MDRIAVVRQLLDIAFKNEVVLKRFAGAAVRYALGYLVGLGVRAVGKEYAPQLEAFANDLEPLAVMLFFSLLAKARDEQKRQQAEVAQA